MNWLKSAQKAKGRFTNVMQLNNLHFKKEIPMISILWNKLFYLNAS